MSASRVKQQWNEIGSNIIEVQISILLKNLFKILAVQLQS